MHRQVKLYLGNGLGDLLYLARAVHEVIRDTAQALRREEAHQKTSLLQKHNGKQWLGKLHYQISWKDSPKAYGLMVVYFSKGVDA